MWPRRNASPVAKKIEMLLLKSCSLEIETMLPGAPRTRHEVPYHADPKILVPTLVIDPLNLITPD